MQRIGKESSGAKPKDSKDGKTGGGTLVDPDSPDALATGLHALWADPALRERLGRSAFEGVRAHYTIAHSADRLIAAYESLASGASRTVA